ncbi:NACHT, LRR and PYD domains-containing protein 12-like [Chanos chanos]|uniref:NACHT, LRR and PYD domains-containing protein 12-like n=1 Tax=Chanos chanos TaxID=29144 RepID=A0A6J2US73_CHACN|nr:NACHT, LRR and PYD domains-containing protein 12-like [Chanos chanos]
MKRSQSPIPSCQSVKSAGSMDRPIDLRQEPCTGDQRDEQKRSESPVPSCQSVNSAGSMDRPIDLRQEPCTGDQRDEQMRSGTPVPSCQSVKSAGSMDRPIDLRQEPCTGDQRYHSYSGHGDVDCDFCTGVKLRAVKSCLTCPASLCENHVRLHYTIPALQRHTLVEVTGDLEQRLCQQHHRVLEVFCKTDQTHICKVCAVEEHRNHNKLCTEISGVPDAQDLLQRTVENMKRKDLRSFRKQLSEDCPEYLGSQMEDFDVSGIVEKLLECFGGEGALRIVLHFLDVANSLRAVTEANKVNLKGKYQHVSEGLSPQGKLAFLSHIYTDINIIECRSGKVNNEHEVIQIEMTSKSQITQDSPINCNDIFKTVPGQIKQIRTVLTKGIAGIGKTVSVHNFIIDWAKGKANQDITVIVSLPFIDLNLKKENYSLIQLLHHYAPELKEIKDIEDKKLKLLLIFDGLDEYRFPLDFQKSELICDVTKSASVDVLLTNLIKGNLLPATLLWITSRPAAANQIPPQYIHKVTEICGFNDCQKEEYFRKRISDQSLANRIITHIKSSRSLYIMCYIPVFCWLSATVLEHKMSYAGTSEIPKTLTEMYTHFLLLQISLNSKKYHGVEVENPKKLSQSDKEMILKLAELAFQQLEKGNLMFYEEDLKECGIHVSEASEYSSVCTEIFREELELYREKVFCFVHLSIQEHLAAVYAHVTCVNESRNVLLANRDEEDRFTLLDLHQRAVDKALQSKNGQLDLFLRFLLGLSLDSNQRLLQVFMTRDSSGKSDHSSIVSYIKEKIKREPSPDMVMNLFQCLNELNENSLAEEIQTTFRSGTVLVKELEPYQCSALAYMFLMSEEMLDEFDLKMYKTSASGRQRLLPVLRTCRKARLDHCHLTSESCVTVASALQSINSPLKELDLSHNTLTDSGVKLLCAALMSPSCQLQKLNLRECTLTASCCEDLASVLRSPPSNLRELELRDNDLQDSGVKALSDGLKDPQCKLNILGLSGCLITEEGCASLASALRSNPSHLRELDLSYNHPGDTGVKLLSALLEDPHCKLEKLELGHGGDYRMKPGLKKYACQLTLDQNTAHRRLFLSNENRTAEGTLENHQYPDHPDRFQNYLQVLSKESLTDRCYWEVEWHGVRVFLGVTDNNINRSTGLIGGHDRSLSLVCLESLAGFCFCQNGEITLSPSLSASCQCTRVGIYLDWVAGTVTFYNIVNDTPIILRTFHTTFTEPLYAGFEVSTGSTVTLCQMD